MDKADQHARVGQHASAASRHEAALADSSLVSGDRAHTLADLADAYPSSGRVEDAIRVARDGMKLAQSSRDEQAEAHTRISLATALLADFDSSGTERSFLDAMQCLDRSASIYERLGEKRRITSRPR
jgi:hypothetical protein